ncbi:MAG: sulfite exporter TauE/SafE family protein [Caldilineaceae bacterium]|nr:sulfite exporter TauE/SafE family protein [Caldilineaceae bacterium]
MQTVQTPPKSGVSQAQPGKQQGSADSGRMQIFFHALAFVLGFSIVFTLFGSAAGLVGRSMNQYLIYLQRFGAILLVIFALSTMGVFRWLADYLTRATDLETNPAAAALVSILSFFNGLMYGERRVVEMHEVNRGYGYLSSMLLGMSFSAGWAPCIGPILAGILFLAGDSATVTTGAVLLGVYSLGLGIPFLITGAAFSTTTKWLRKINRYSNSIGFVSGIFLLLVAFLLWTDSLATLTTRFSFLNEMVFGLEEALVGGTGAGIDIFNVNLASALPLAFTAGIISFISPCVLPLVPAYLGYLSGTAVSSRR